MSEYTLSYTLYIEIAFWWYLVYYQSMNLKLFLMKPLYNFDIKGVPKKLWDDKAFIHS
jgi:hypothetical protein